MGYRLLLPNLQKKFVRFSEQGELLTNIGSFVRYLYRKVFQWLTSVNCNNLAVEFGFLIESGELSVVFGAANDGVHRVPVIARDMFADSVRAFTAKLARRTPVSQLCLPYFLC